MMLVQYIKKYDDRDFVNTKVLRDAIFILENEPDDMDYAIGLIKSVVKKPIYIGCLYAGKDQETGEVAIGFSKYNQEYEDKPFSREKALALAMERAWVWTERFEEKGTPDIPFSIANKFGAFIMRAKAYYKDGFMTPWVQRLLNETKVEFAE